MDPFWGITLSYLVLRKWWRHQKEEEALKKQDKEEFFEKYDYAQKTVAQKTPEQLAEELAQQQFEAERQKDINDLKKQGYTDELIAVILPTIRNGQ